MKLGFKKVLWSGETQTEHFATLAEEKKKCYAWQKSHIDPTVKHEGGSIMLWVYSSSADERLM